jgi:hypothetical protein
MESEKTSQTIKDGVFIMRSGKFEKFANTVMDSKDILNAFNNRKYTIKNTGGVKYRWINYWTEIGLLDDNRDANQKWRRFSLVDMVWLLIIRDLRKFGLSNDKIAVTKKCVFEIDRDFKIKFPIFEAYLINAFLSNKPCNLLVFSDGSSVFVSDDELDFSRNVRGLDKNFISISLNNILQEFFKNRNLQPKYVFKFALSDSEERVIDKVRQGNFKKVELYLKNGKIIRIHSTEEAINKRFIDLIKEAKHQKIMFESQDGKTVLFERTIKEKV